MTVSSSCILYPYLVCISAVGSANCISMSTLLCSNHKGMSPGRAYWVAGTCCVYSRTISYTVLLWAMNWMYNASHTASVVKVYHTAWQQVWQDHHSLITCLSTEHSLQPAVFCIPLKTVGKLWYGAVCAAQRTQCMGLLRQHSRFSTFLPASIAHCTEQTVELTDFLNMCKLLCVLRVLRMPEGV